MINELECPCGCMVEGSNGKACRKLFSVCCKPFIQGDAKPDHCEQLMRSRYTAYSMGEADYLIKTWHPSKQTQLNRSDLLQSAKETQWLSLEVIKSAQKDAFGTVEFNAFYQNREINSVPEHARDKGVNCLHEVSRFEKIADQWFYLDGKVDGELDSSNQVKVGRNDLCPCGSGKKFKKCCDR